MRGWAPRWWEMEMWDTFCLHQKLLLMQRRERLQAEGGDMASPAGGFGVPPPIDQLSQLPGWQGYSPN